MIDRLARRYAGKGAQGGPDVLAVLPKALEGALGPLVPDNVGTLHFGKLRGQDGFRGVAAALIVSRPMPAPRDAEDMAEVVFGGDPVDRLPDGAFYPLEPAVRVMADGTGQTAAAHRHPDPRAEAVRRAVCEAEVVQAVGRVRGSRRTVADPVEVLIMTGVPLGADVRPDRALPLAEAWREWGGLDAVTALLEAGIVPEDWAGRGAILAAAGSCRGPRPSDRPRGTCSGAIRPQRGACTTRSTGRVSGLRRPGAVGVGSLRIAREPP